MKSTAPTFNKLICYFFDTTLWWIQEKHIPKERVSKDLNLAFIDLNSLDELNEKVFWRQINFFKRLYSKNKDCRITALRSVVYFYRFLMNEYPYVKIFDTAHTLYPSLLENRSFVTDWLENNYMFMTFSPGLTYEGRDRYIFIFRGAENLSSRLRKTDYKKIDLSPLKSNYYRKCVFNFLCSDIRNVLRYSPTAYCTSLNTISELKCTQGYRNIAEDSLNTSELIHVIEELNVRLKADEAQVRSFLSFLKNFFHWAVSHKHIRVDDTFFDNFTLFRSRNYVPRTQRPKAEHIDIILDASKKKAEENPQLYLIFDVIIRLLLSNKLRVSAICGLERDCIIPQITPQYYRIKYIDKANYGDVNQTATITVKEKELIEKAINYTRPLQEKAQLEKKCYIFLYVPNRKTYVKCANGFDVIDYLKLLCNENRLPNITPTQLRKEYQSQVKAFSIKNNCDDIQEKSLTGHSHAQTTDRHYVKIRMEEYFEQMYMVSLHDKKIDGFVSEKVRDIIPSHLERVGDLTYRCGACNATECMIKNALPCFLCKNFITSIEFLPIFKKMVEDISSQITLSNNPHDKEDLVTVKEVLVRYIVELTFKQGI